MPADRRTVMAAIIALAAGNPVEHVISNSHLYPRTRQRTALITAGLRARKRATTASRQGKLINPLTPAEIRVLEKLPERLTYTE